MPGADELWAVVAAAHPDAPTELAGVLRSLCARVRAAYPALPFDELAFVRAVAHHAGETDPVAFCATCRAEELGIAQLAAAGSSVAIGELERRYGAGAAAACRQFAGAAHTVDDLHQALRDKLYVVSPGASPTIAAYNGQGSLATWLRVIATRLFIDLGRRKDRMRETVATDELLEPAAAYDLALDAIKAEYRESVTAALWEAVRSLEPGDRHLLRQHLVAGLSIDQLGAAMGIHRATAARRIARAREALAVRTRTLVATRLALSDAELAELVGLVMSRLDLTVGRLLATTPSP